jgi:proline iminopeptidase
MRIDINGARLWFDVAGSLAVADGPVLAMRPTVVVVHGGPAIYDHSYLRPAFDHLADRAQVIYLDLRDHGRSSRQDPADWSLQACADDIRAFCDTLGITAPIVLGHSLGSAVVALYGAQHPGHAAGLALLAPLARFDLARVADGFRAVAGDEVAELAQRVYAGHAVSDAELARVFAATGPNRPRASELARIVVNRELAGPGLKLLPDLDILDQLGTVASPTVIYAGGLDPLAPVAAGREIVEALPAGRGHLRVIDQAGHFPWLDCAPCLWPGVDRFVADPTSIHRPGAGRPSPVDGHCC